MNAHPSFQAAAIDEPEYLLMVPLRERASRRWALWSALAALLLAAAGIALWQWLDNRAQSVDIAVPPDMPADLLAATRGAEGARQAEGVEAEALNAALPFAIGPMDAARPFGFTAGTQPDHMRALHCLTQAVYYEAGFEPMDGRRAVAQVVLNRVRHPAFPNSVCGVVYDGSSRPGCQFSFTCDGSLRRAPSPAAWAAAEQVAREALQGHVAAGVGTATHYHANYVSPYWAPRLTKLSQIGAHIFYRWPGGWGRSAAFTSRYAGSETIMMPALVDLPEMAAAEAVAPAPDPTDRRAPEDVGGRLDTTKGWTLSIPLPSESRGQLASALNRQGGEDAPAISSAAEAAR